MRIQAVAGNAVDVAHAGTERQAIQRAAFHIIAQPGAGLIARRILCHVKEGDTLRRGQRYGFIRFGSRVDVYLPVTAQPQVAPGDKVRATSTILAYLADTEVA